MTRREKFRAYMARMSAAANPKLAIEQELYVDPPDAISDLIVSRLELEPSSRHLVVGSVGAGKTTQLLIAQKRLNASGDVLAEYIDVSEKQDLAHLRPGCLVALAGSVLHSHLEEYPNHKLSWDGFKAWASGYWSFPDFFDEEPDDGRRWVPGIVKPPTPLTDIPPTYVTQIRMAHEFFVKQGQTLIFLFDSLDRITKGKSFSQTIEQDVAALHNAGIGLVLVGPVQALSGFGRLDADKFDDLHIQAPIDLKGDDNGKQFLLNILERRAGPNMLEETAADLLVDMSGGVLRDLIHLAKSAGDEAYRRGSDTIQRMHVEGAAESFGRALLVGLNPKEVDTLKHLLRTGGFVHISDDDLALIATRRILDYRGRSSAYAVHPTIAPLLDQMA